MLLAKEYPTLSLFSTLHSPSSLPPHVPRPARTRDCGQHSVDRQRDTASATAPTPPGFLSSTLSGTLLGTFSPSSAVWCHSYRIFGIPMYPKPVTLFLLDSLERWNLGLGSLGRFLLDRYHVPFGRTDLFKDFHFFFSCKFQDSISCNADWMRTAPRWTASCLSHSNSFSYLSCRPSLPSPPLGRWPLPIPQCPPSPSSGQSSLASYLT